MNERIKENWEKATGSAIPGPGFFASASDYNIEKFAELIVNECMTMCDETRADYLKHRKSAYDFQDKNIYAEGEAACDILKYKMKRQFGVQ